MSEMVERVAKAIHADRSLQHCEWETEAPTMRGFYLSCARAAIEAMREPTREMTAAAQTRWNAGHDRTAWRLMIDEALK